MSAKDKIPAVADPNVAERPYTARESWRIFGIMAEFVEATERLAAVRPAVSIFGSARVAPDHPYQDISQTFQHFFARKFMFVKMATAYVVLPGGFGTLDELLEAMTLIKLLLLGA
jgi:hypothetical protein